MKIKEQKLILHFLKQLRTILENDKNQKLNKLFKDFFTREELLEILEHSILDKDLKEHNILTLGSDELLELVGEDYFILSFLIEILENSISAVLKMTQTEVHRFFDQIQVDPIYLRDKPVGEWNGYDRSNYYSLLSRHRKTKRVFAIFTSDVKSEDKYAETTKPSYFFETKEEAKKELKNIIAEGQLTKEDLVIHSLWHITQN